MSSSSEIPDWFEGDPYFKLRAPLRTPDDEMCECERLVAIMLRYAGGENPFHCVDCRGEVAPERIGFDWRPSEDIARWLCLFRSLYYLWLDSDEYELWALKCLQHPLGRVNSLGLANVQRLNHYCRAYYWWFVDTEVSDMVEQSSCPVCGNALTIDDANYRKCETCSILM